MASKTLSETLNSELRAANPDLVGNDDLLRSVLSGCGDCIKVLDMDGRLQFMSEGGKRVMEVEDFSPLKGCPWPSFWVGEGNAQAIAAMGAARAGKTGRFRGPASTAKGTPKYWDVQVAPIYGTNGKISNMLSISKDITEEWHAAERERFLAEELEHRTKNSFAMVIAIAKQTFRGNDLSSPLATYIGRIMALAQAHEAANKANGGNVSVKEAIETALALHRSGESRFSLRGPNFTINPRQALALSLAVNELATNAAKHGSLSLPSGQVDISWSFTEGPNPTFSFVWKEHGGPPVSEPTRQGFGARLIKDFLASDFGGNVEVTYRPSGLVCELTAPLETLPNRSM